VVSAVAAAHGLVTENAMMLNRIIAAPQRIDLLVICIRVLLSFSFHSQHPSQH
jgi:hypothetical protein